MALITSEYGICAPCTSNGPNHLGLSALQSAASIMSRARTVSREANLDPVRARDAAFACASAAILAED